MRKKCRRILLAKRKKKSEEQQLRDVFKNQKERKDPAELNLGFCNIHSTFNKVYGVSPG